MSSDEEEQELDAYGNSGEAPEERGGAYTMNFRMYENQFPEIDEVRAEPGSCAQAC